MYYGLALAVTALILLLEHWFPWPRRFHQLVNYTLGSGGILAGVAIWLVSIGRPGDIFPLLGFYAAGGTAVLLAYAVDYVLNLRQRVRIHERSGK